MKKSIIVVIKAGQKSTPHMCFDFEWEQGRPPTSIEVKNTKLERRARVKPKSVQTRAERAVGADA